MIHGTGYFDTLHLCRILAQTLQELVFHSNPDSVVFPSDSVLIQLNIDCNTKGVFSIHASQARDRDE